jgi:hypothetical protein
MAHNVQATTPRRQLFGTNEAAGSEFYFLSKPCVNRASANE